MQNYNSDGDQTYHVTTVIRIYSMAGFNAFDFLTNYAPNTIVLAMLSAVPMLPYTTTNLPLVPLDITAPVYIQMTSGPTWNVPDVVSFDATATIIVYPPSVPYYVYGWALIAVQSGNNQLLFAGALDSPRAFVYAGQTQTFNIFGQYTRQPQGN